MEIYSNDSESDFETDIESDFVTCNEYCDTEFAKKSSVRKRISGGNVSRDGLRWGFLCKLDHIE